MKAGSDASDGDGCIRDVMPAFELFQPTSVDARWRCSTEHGADAWVLAGGLDSFDWLKDRIKRPRVVVDLSGDRRAEGHPRARRRPRDRRDDHADRGRAPSAGRASGSRSCCEAAEAAASPQIRNQGTIGGNVTQDTRCWYYRAGWPCYRAGGNICYADTPQAINREHAIFDADRCVAVNPSDTAPALIALDAQMVIRSVERRARRRGRGLLHRPGHRHHAHDGAAAGRAADGDPHPRHVGGRAVLLREGRATATCGTSRWSTSRRRCVMSAAPIERMRIAANGVAARPLRLRRGRSTRCGASRATRRRRRLAGDAGHRGRASRCSTTPTRCRCCATW